MRQLHLLALPHTQTTADYAGCAYTSKVRKMAKMMTDAGHRVILYAGEHNDAPCAEHVEVIADRERERWFGKHDPGTMPDVGWAADDPWWRTFQSRAEHAIRKRYEPRDLILMTTSHAQKPIADSFPEMLAVEHGVGYIGVLLGNTWAAYESKAWRHYIYGWHRVADGRNYDAVIPNYFDPDEFPHTNKRDGDYLMFLGRVTPRKGVQEAWEVAERAGIRLVVAGPQKAPGGVQDEVTLPAWVEAVGPVNVKERASLLAGARALMVPTRYIEPFGGVAVEAIMCGTPVIATDWGAFTETVEPGTTGYRFRTLAEGVQAVKDVDLLPSGEELRSYALRKWSLQAVAPQYEAWFSQLDGLWGKGWYE